MTVTTKVGRRLATLATVLAVAVMTEGAEAADVRVISAGAVRAILTEMAHAYEKESGNTVVLMFGTVGVVMQKMAASRRTWSS